MINEVNVDLTTYYDRIPWGIVYYNGSKVEDSDYCDSLEDCIASLDAHKEQFMTPCRISYLVPAVHEYELEAFMQIMCELSSHLEKNGFLPNL